MPNGNIYTYMLVLGRFSDTSYFCCTEKCKLTLTLTLTTDMLLHLIHFWISKMVKRKKNLPSGYYGKGSEYTVHCSLLCMELHRNRTFRLLTLALQWASELDHGAMIEVSLMNSVYFYIIWYSGMIWIKLQLDPWMYKPRQTSELHKNTNAHSQVLLYAPWIRPVWNTFASAGQPRL